MSVDKPPHRAHGPLSADALALELRAGEGVRVGDDRAHDALVVADARAMTLDLHNGLLEVGGGVRLPDAARFAAEQGYAFPLGDSVPDLTLTDACFRMPPFVDAFVASAELVTSDGVRATTPRAPRSATGPDLMGLALVDPPLAVIVRARVRVFPTGTANARDELHPTPLEVAMRVAEIMNDGRAFVVEAARGRVRVLGPAPVSARSVLDATTLPRVQSGRSIVVSENAILQGLVNDGRVLAAPYMGRIAILDDTPRSARFERHAVDVRSWRVDVGHVRS
jgi:FAD/FMN-containing dehydrogenase